MKSQKQTAAWVTVNAAAQKPIGLIETTNSKWELKDVAEDGKCEPSVS